MGIFFALIAALFTSISNFCMRRSIDAGGSSRAYLVIQLMISFFVMLLLNPVRTGNFDWQWSVTGLGLVGGILFGFLMWSIGKTLEKGPPGLSFAILNTSTVIPAIFMAILFGASFGHPYSFWNGLGSILVVSGLFWAAGAAEKNPQKAIWATFAIVMFAIHILFLVYLQWWALLLKPDHGFSSLLSISIDPTKVQWFMPAIFFVGTLMQGVVYLSQEKRWPNKSEMFYGVLGGITNAVCTFFLILAPQKAAAWENAMLFPIFSVSIIILCNIWAQLLYKERVNWKANAVCLAGLLIGTISWSAF